MNKDGPKGLGLVLMGLRVMGWSPCRLLFIPCNPTHGALNPRPPTEACLPSYEMLSSKFVATLQNLPPGLMQLYCENGSDNGHVYA
jgi:hypothetical protein